MAPGYRAQNRRQNRTGYVDHDVFEGLPVRHWRRDYVTVAPPPTQESTTSQNDIWAVELPHGMPKDSHLLPQHSQDLLRAARSGRIYKRPAPAEEEEADPEAILGDKPEKKDDDPKDRGFTAKAWKQIPRHMEGPDVEYLAKRRKGLVTIASKTAPGPTLTKTTVKRVDAAGNEYVQDVVVPHGQKVEGEIIAQTTIPDPGASGSLGEGFATQPTPPKRKGPIIRKKPKGPGRGRKKKILAPTSVPQNTEIDGAIQTSEGIDGAPALDGMKTEPKGSVPPASNEDTEMAEDSILASDDDDGEEGEDGEDGEGNDDDEGSLDIQNSPSKPRRTASPPAHAIPAIKEIPKFVSPDVDMAGTEYPSPSIANLERERHEGKSGSPLKNVALSTSSLTSPLQSPTVSSGPASFPDIIPVHEPNPEPLPGEPEVLDAVMQEETVETAPTELPPQPLPEPTMAEVIAAVEVLQEEEEEEEMLLDIVENANNAQIGGDHVSIIPPPEEHLDPMPGVQEPEVNVTPDIPSEVVIASTIESDIVLPQELVTPEPEVAEPVDDDDDFPDLLGGLEQQLNKPVAPAPITESIEEAVVETVAQLVTEEPVDEPVIEPVVEPVMEPVVELVKESVVEPVTDLVTEPMSEVAQKEPLSEKLVESVIKEMEPAESTESAEKDVVTEQEEGS